MDINDVLVTPFYFGLHPPIPELHLAQLVGAHDALSRRRGLLLALAFTPVLVDPVLAQRAPPRLLGDVHRGVLLLGVFEGGVLE